MSKKSSNFAADFEIGRKRKALRRHIENEAFAFALLTASRFSYVHKLNTINKIKNLFV